MAQSELILYLLKLILGGLTAFLAVLLWSKTRDSAWMSLVAGVVIHYAGIVYNLLLDFGFVFTVDFVVFGIPITSLLFTTIPLLFFILAFSLMLRRLL